MIATFLKLFRKPKQIPHATQPEKEKVPTEAQRMKEIAKKVREEETIAELERVADLIDPIRELIRTQAERGICVLFIDNTLPKKYAYLVPELHSAARVLAEEIKKLGYSVSVSHTHLTIRW